MPTIFGFLTKLVLLAVVIYTAMYLLVLFVKPRQGEISERITIQMPAAPEPVAPAEPGVQR